MLHVSETFFKGVYSIWLFVAEQKNYLLPPKHLMLHLSYGAILKSAPTLSRISSLQSDSNFFLFIIASVNFCQLEKPTSVSQVPWETPSRLGTLKLLTIDLSLGENKVTVSGAVCVMSAWHCFECGIISWCSFPGSYYPLSFTKADSCLSLTTGCPQRKWTSALGILGQKGSEGLWEWWCVLGRRSYVEKEQVKGRDWRGIWRKVRAKKNFWKWSRGELTTTLNSPQCLWEKNPV